MNRSVKIIIAIVIIALVGALAYIHLEKWHQQKVEKAVSVERETWEEKTEALQQEMTSLKKDLKATEKPGPPNKKIIEVWGSKPSSPDRPPAQPPEEKAVADQILSFFEYLDQRPYVKSFIGPEGSYRQYQVSIDLLSRKTPLIAGETADLDRLAKNMAHLYRTLGKDRIKLISLVLQNEADIIETVAQTFYTWYAAENPDAYDLRGRPSLKTQYTYAVFLLNTLAGRSYLLRRDSRIRNLTYYYAVRILDRANQNKLNALGLDIRPHIKNIYRDIQFQRGLAERRYYLKELEQLAQKYNAD